MIDHRALPYSLASVENEAMGLVTWIKNTENNWQASQRLTGVIVEFYNRGKSEAAERKSMCNCAESHPGFICGGPGCHCHDEDSTDTRKWILALSFELDDVETLAEIIKQMNPSKLKGFAGSIRITTDPFATKIENLMDEV